MGGRLAARAVSGYLVAMRPPAFLREPLVHFLLLGALLFALYQWRSGGAGSNRIVITTGQVGSLAASFERTWMRPPTDEELKGLVDDFVREELAVREATAQGLEQGDIVIRRRLRQKYEFLLEDEVAAAAPTDAELQAWLDAHQDEFRHEPVIGLRQVFVNTDRRGTRAQDDAMAILTRLRAGADPLTAGDPTMLPLEVAPGPRSDLGRQFGDEFASAADSLEPGQWAGPIRSGYGLHLVYVTEKAAGSAPSLDQVRDEVAREFLAARRTAGLDSLYQRLSGKYRILIERPGDTP